MAVVIDGGGTPASKGGENPQSCSSNQFQLSKNSKKFIVRSEKRISLATAPDSTVSSQLKLSVRSGHCTKLSIDYLETQ